ncbi:unnamed protein product [Callosobruchus maculatus]|nr:unnamed protein product [Callosobruchus maculatus]
MPKLDSLNRNNIAIKNKTKTALPNATKPSSKPKKSAKGAKATAAMYVAKLTNSAVLLAGTGNTNVKKSQDFSVNTVHTKQSKKGQ